MKNVSGIIPCYAADTSGVCSALYELGGMTVVHDASGCNSTYSTHDEPRWYDMRSNIFISALTELDAIMGNDEKLIEDTVSAAKDRAPRFIAVCGSPMPMMTGVDFDAVAAEIESRSGIRTFALHTNGTRSYIEGASEAFLELVKEYARPCSKTEGGVAVLGLTPLDFPLGADKEIRRWLSENGFRCLSALAMGDDLGSVGALPAAELSLVVSQTGLAAAEYLKEEYGIPYVCGVPFGKEFAVHLAAYMKDIIKQNMGCSPVMKPCCGFEDADTVVIGEGFFAGSLTAALREDMNIKALPLCTLPAYGPFKSLIGGEISAEEDIKAFLEEKKPGTVIADPLFRYIVPKETRLIEVPHFAFSGRCFQRDMKNMINTDIKEYFK